MRRAATLLASLALVCLTAAPANAVDTRVWNYRSCNEYHDFTGGGGMHVCVKALVARHADGTGTDTTRVHVYYWTGSYHQGECGTPGITSVENNDVTIDAVNLAGSHTTKWVRHNPDLTQSDCDVVWDGFSQSVNTVTTQIEFDHTARIHLGVDKTAWLLITVTDTGFWCQSEAEDCSRALAKQ